MQSHRSRVLLRLLLFGSLLAAAVLVAAALRSAPVPVDVATVLRGPLTVTLDEEGETRVRDRAVIAAPVAGHLARIALDEGDAATQGQVVARLAPLPLDPRGREQAEANLAASAATAREARARVREARAAVKQAETTLGRTERLAAAGQLPAEELDRARTAQRTQAQGLAAAEFRAQAAASEMAAARAALQPAGTGGGSGAVIEVRSPVVGRVLRVYEESERVVQAGTPLLEIGDPQALEIVVDLLSTDAVQVQPGAAMLVGGGGGELAARVRKVEPSGFTKVSPLGVEEQRVNVIGDFVDPPGRLGDRYRVEAKIVLWRGAGVLKVAGGALFRSGDGWAVYRVEGGRAKKRPVRIGHRSADETEVLSGLAAGDRVILHPGDRVEEGARVEVR
jgi:HlyD family secretion protein